MQRITDPRSHDLDIMHKEMANPTGLLHEARKDAMEPLGQSLSAIVRELLGDKADERTVGLCQMSILSQCFGPMMHKRHRGKSPRAAGSKTPAHLEENVEILADHVAGFCLAGIRDIRRNAGKAVRREKKRK